MTLSQPDPIHLWAVVDMGSNGIRFSISNLHPCTARILPTLYQKRVGISLYDAQYSTAGEKQPIDDSTLARVISSLQQFRQVCEDFEVPSTQVVVLATEATRSAQNSEDFMEKIHEQVGWKVIMLSKEEEGCVGAMGIASSLPQVKGLVMDLGGGSTQLSWIIKEEGSDIVHMPHAGAVSMPYGAAAVIRRLSQARSDMKVDELKVEIQNALREAYSRLEVPDELLQTAKVGGGFTLYLSGGGFRGWGYILMSKHRARPYPIPVINGFKVNRREFLETEEVERAATASLTSEDHAIFRISERRAMQVPAVAFLVNTLAEALPPIKEVRFCQGGVRDGYLFSSLAPQIQAQHPLVIATQPFSNQPSSKAIADLLEATFPASMTVNTYDNYKNTFTPAILQAFANLIYYHSSYAKDLQAISALRCTTSGILAGVHGVSHESRVLLALLLCKRWGDDIPPIDIDFKRNLERLIDSPWTLWWVQYVGAVAALVASIYPSGISEKSNGRLKFYAKWDQDEKRRDLLVLNIRFSQIIKREALDKELMAIEKAGKRKKWIGGREGVGHKVLIEISSD